jgi:phospholipid/cholesterol/gamma-HCH transport system substrate-binding protein
MPQHERVQWAQLRVGILVIVSLVVLGIGIFFISGQVGFFARHYTLKCYLPNAGDLREGAQVRLAGISVGNVAKIRMSPFTDRQRAVEIDMKLARTYEDDIRADSVASVETVGLLGDSYIDITRGSPGEQVVPDEGEVKYLQKAVVATVVQNTNDVITNLNTISSKLDDITTQIQSGKGSIGKLIYDQTLYSKLNDTISNAQNLIDRAQRGEGTIGKLMVDETLYNRTLGTLDRLDKVIDQVQHGNGSLARFISDPSAYNNLNRLMANGNAVIDGINQGHGTLGKLAKDEQFYDRMNSTLAHLDTITARIDQGQGTLGKLSTDPSMFNNLSESSQSLKEFLTDFKKNPKKYLTLKMRLF